MFVFRLVFKNALRHKLRTFLTIAGVMIAVFAFGTLRTVVTAWSYGVEASATNRMVTRHSVSFIFPLPLAYRDHISRIPGVEKVTWANWFQGQYKDPNEFKNFFPRLAVDAETYFEVYPEYLMPPDQMAGFLKERNACIVGQKIADQHGLKIGDIMTVEGDIYPGRWDFVVRGFYRGKDPTVDETQMMFHWKYLDERMKESQPEREGMIGWYVLRVSDPSAMPRIAKTIDDNYLNSRAGTKTESEREFAQSFVSMSSAILTSLETISYIIIGVILLVLANTIVMSARERTSEYAVLKTVGFSAFHIAGLIAGESILVAAIGTGLGLALTFPIADGIAAAFPTFFPVFKVQPITMVLAVGIGLLAGAVSAVWPVLRTLNTSIANGLRSIG